MNRNVTLGLGCLALGLGVAANSLLGPLVTGVIDYRTAETGLNQLKGADLASLVVVAPAAIGASALWFSRRPLAPIASLAPAAYAAYTFTQAILGQEYARYEGNNEFFFPLHLGLVVLGGAVASASWTALDASNMALPSRRLIRTAAFTFLGASAFLVLGLHLPGLVALWRGNPGVEFQEAPAAFWVVKLMDLGILVPVSVAAGIGLLRSPRRALRAAYALSGILALIGSSVTAMAVVMQVSGDPAAQPVMIPAFGVITGLLSVLVVRLARSSLGRSPSAERFAAAGSIPPLGG